ncbi:MAG TPA: PQQ-like beta-propeller repeat protein [Anaerolineaceae bacterium]|jgi:outer membrane protein assembly factor BamB|nr:PQQ-like beta-propeller repeat protein [Anaerolineaceae bacterium]
MKQSRYLMVILFVLAATLLSACSGALTASSWPGITPQEDLIYLANGSFVMALRPADGVEVWRFPEKAEGQKMFFAAPVLADGQLIVGDYQHTLYSLNPETGTENWRFEDATNRYIASPLVVADLILAPNADHVLYALDLKGNLVWEYETGQPIWASPVSDGTTAYIAGMDHHLYALDVKTGKLVWDQDLGAAMLYTPALSDSGQLYVSTLKNTVVARDAKTGAENWTWQGAAAVWAQPALKDGFLYFGDQLGTLYCLNAETSAVAWSVEAGGEDKVASFGTPLLLDDVVIYAMENGELVAVSYLGERLWTREAAGTLYTGPVLAGDRFLVGVNKGDNLIETFDLNGNKSWSFKLDTKKK